MEWAVDMFNFGPTEFEIPLGCSIEEAKQEVSIRQISSVYPFGTILRPFCSASWPERLACMECTKIPCIPVPAFRVLWLLLGEVQAED